MDLAAFTAVVALNDSVPVICDAPKGLFINEFKLFSNTTKKFIEIVSSGAPNFPLDQILLVTFDGQTNDTVAAAQLQGRTNSSTGLYTVTKTMEASTDNITDLLSQLNGVSCHFGKIVKKFAAAF